MQTKHIIGGMYCDANRTHNYWGVLNTLRERQNGRHFADDIYKSIFVNEKVQFNFHWSLFLGVQLTINQHCSDNGLVPNMRQAIIWTNDCLVYRRIYASPGLIELNISYIKSGYGVTLWSVSVLHYEESCFKKRASWRKSRVLFLNSDPPG